MNFANVLLVFRREIRDQLRDRRTLFTIAVLPILLYPLIGMTMLQVVQFRREHPAKIWVMGREHLESLASRHSDSIEPLIVAETVDADGDSDAETIYRFNQSYQPGNQELIQLLVDHQPTTEVESAIVRLAEQSSSTEQSETQIRSIVDDYLSAENIDALIYVQPIPDQEGDAEENQVDLPQIVVIGNSSSDKSEIAQRRVDQIIERYRLALVKTNLEAKQISQRDTEPFRIVTKDVAAEESRRAANWSKILTFVMLIWALTGAFYPAIDLCAGEKERGTLETLLSSPAKRIEIVWGKLLTIMVFSICTALLNLMSMGLTATYSLGQMAALSPNAGAMPIGAPPLSSIFWLLLAVIPISALFGALSLAIAAFARSSKEGQYYLMPLLLVTLPLMVLSVLPGAELDFGTSLIPVTGMMLLLQALIEGEHAEALRYGLPVLGVTAFCCLFAVRWAVDQFNNESVLFRESERLGVGIWLRHMLRDRGSLPTPGEAILCGMVILLIRFFANFFAKNPEGWNDLVTSTTVTLLAWVATPALLMTIMLTRRPAQTLRLRIPRGETRLHDSLWWITIPGAGLLAVCMHPVILWLSSIVVQIYPVSPELIEFANQLDAVKDLAPNFLSVVALFALVPAICEEVAFRGFILSGLSSMGRKWMAIFVSALFFGATHGIIQQSLVACFSGMILGFIAIQTRSLYPCIVYHFTNNFLGLWISSQTPDGIKDSGWKRLVLQMETESDVMASIGYQPLLGTVLLLSALVLLGLLSRLKMRADDAPPPAHDS